ncbi:acylphosphatase [Corynebacterium glucuronolyticum]
MQPMTDAQLLAFVHGHVQGVGFRWWVKSQALALGLRGEARNKWDGRVEVVAEGDRAACEELLERLCEQPSAFRRPGHVTVVVEQWKKPRGFAGFKEA